MTRYYRDESIDILRGIAMLCVMLGHLGYVPEAIMQWLNPFYVPVFFFITGYLKNDANIGMANIIKRFKRLLLPYFLYNFLLILCYIPIHHIGVGDIFFAVKGILYSRFCLLPDVEAQNNIFFFTVSNSPLWFLTALFLAEVYFELISCIKKNRGMIVKAIILLAVGYLATYLKILLPWSLDTAMIGTIFMMAGYYWKENGGNKVKCYVLFFVYIILAYINPKANMSVRYYGPRKISIFLFVLAGIIGSILMKFVSEWIAQCKYLDIFKKVFCIIGKNSLPILALHWFIFSFCDIVMEKMHMTILWKGGYGLFKIGLSVIVCVFFQKLLNYFYLIKRDIYSRICTLVRESIFTKGS